MPLYTPESGLNLDLLVPIFLMILVLRTKNVYFPIQNYLLYGLRLYLPQEFSLQKPAGAKAKAGLRELDNKPLTLEEKLDLVDVGPLITLNKGIQSLRFIKSLTFYNAYDTLVYVFVAAFLISIWSTMYQCYSPMLERFTMHANMVIFAAGMIAIHTQMQIIILTGVRAEIKLSAIIGMSVIIIVLASLSFDTTLDLLFGTSERRGEDVINATAAHMNALLLQLSASAPQPSLVAMNGFVKILISFVCGALAAGCVIPSLHFSRSLLTLTTSRGTANERATTRDSLLLWVDFFAPILAFLVILTHGDGSPYSLGVIILSLFITALLRFSCLKLHLQSFLDTVVRSILVPFIASADDLVNQAPILQEKVAARVTYLALAAAQYISHPIILTIFAILMHRASPRGIGLCPIVRKDIFGMDNSILEAVINKEMSFDATSVAIAVAPHPYFTSAISAFLLGSGMGGISPSLQIRNFFQKALKDLRFLPVGIFPLLGRGIMVIYCVTWFLIHVGSTLYWLMNPQKMAFQGASVGDGGIGGVPSTNVKSGKDAKKD